MCLKNDCNHGCRTQDTTSLKCEIGRLYKLIGELNAKIDSIRNPEKSAPKEAEAPREAETAADSTPWFVSKTPEQVGIEILKASKYIFDKNVEVSYRPAESPNHAVGMEFRFKVHHTEERSSILAEEMFFCPFCFNLEQTVERFDSLCNQMHAIRLRHEDEPKAIEEARKQAQQNFAAFRHLLKDIVTEVLGEKHAEPMVAAPTKEEQRDYCAKLYSSREGKELLIRNSRYAISPARMSVGKPEKDKKGTYVPITFFSDGKGSERKREARKLYVDNGVTHQDFDKLAASLKIVKFHPRGWKALKPVNSVKKTKKGGK